MSACSVAGCDRPVIAKGICKAHHKRLMKYGSPTGGNDRLLYTVDGVRAACEFNGCGRDVAVGGYCTMHYQRWRKYGDPAGAHKPDMVERFWAKVDKTDDCWVWTGAITSSGYGQSAAPRPGPKVYAHRYSLMLHLGMFDSRLFALHHCDNPRCVNPDHLYLGTHADNMRDMVARGRNNSYQARKTHCKNGHEFSGDNFYIAPGNGQRVCRVCQRNRRSVTA